MREIKFKAKRKDNGEWVYGDLIQLLGKRGNGRKFIVNNIFGACINDKGSFINTEAPFVNEVIPSTICQYTGLKDKNGVEIYENDLVKYPFETLYQVMFDPQGYWCLDGNGVRNSEMLYYNDIFEDMEVIGNVYDKENANANTTN